jgi:hypothetical protein
MSALTSQMFLIRRSWGNKNQKNRVNRRIERKNMTASGLKRFAAGVVAVALLLGLATTGRATLVIEQISPPVMTGSWDVGFYAFGNPFDTITGTIISGGAFEDPGLRASGWFSSGNDSVADISGGSAVNALVFIAHFAGEPPLPGATPPFVLNFEVFNEGSKVGETMLGWTGNEFDVVPVPEPSTLLAGVLLLLPFGASTLRSLRKRQAA